METAEGSNECAVPTTAQAADPPAQAPDESQYRGSRRRRSRNSRKLEREKRITRNLKLALAVLLVFITVVLVVGSRTQSHLVEQNDRLKQELNRSRQTLKRTEAMNQQLRSEVDAMVETRLPGLSDISFDEVIPLNQDYVKNVILGLSRDAGLTAYEYRFALFNPNTTPVLPRFSLYLFDERGIQVGGTKVTETGEASEGIHRALGPGEIRSYSGQTTTIGGREPKFFMIDLQ